MAERAGGNDYEVKKWATASIEAGGSQDLAEKVASTQSSIGYLEFEYADRNHLVTANIQMERQGKTIIAVPSVVAIRAAVPKDAAELLSAAKDEEVQQEFPRSMYTSNNAQLIPYPISGFSWLVPSRWRATLEKRCVTFSSSHLLGSKRMPRRIDTRVCLLASLGKMARRYVRSADPSD
jgi:ABC-type phosphate transport system substrate-binding protein